MMLQWFMLNGGGDNISGDVYDDGAGGSHDDADC